MDIDKQSWLTGVRHLPSPFCDERPHDTTISLLVIHNISLPPQQYGSDAIERFFTGRLDKRAHPFFRDIADMRVSAHCLIKRDGEIIQFVPFNKRAWHAGVSSFAGEPRCNDYSIGIELEGSDFDVYTDEQYTSLIEVTRTLCHTFPAITSDRITGHQYIAPLRKTDPALTFDWSRYRKGTNK